MEERDKKRVDEREKQKNVKRYQWVYLVNFCTGVSSD